MASRAQKGDFYLCSVSRPSPPPPPPPLPNLLHLLLPLFIFSQHPLSSLTPFSLFFSLLLGWDLCVRMCVRACMLAACVSACVRDGSGGAEAFCSLFHLNVARIMLPESARTSRHSANGVCEDIALSFFYSSLPPLPHSVIFLPSLLTSLPLQD